MSYFDIPIAEWVDNFIFWLVTSFEGFFDSVSGVLRFFMDEIAAFFLWIPAELLTVLLALLAWKVVGRGMALFVVAGLLLIGGMDLWDPTMETLALIVVSSGLAILLGIPLGVLASQNDVADRVMRPVLDFMQTMPSFVYLIPVLMLFGIGTIPGVIATVIFAMPPVVRLTNLGVRQVPEDIVEAARSFGSTRRQILMQAQIPNALPTLMAGVNQTMLMALSMSVIAAMIGAGGLGAHVYRGIATVQAGIGFEGGLGIIVVAIILDRISQSLARGGGDTNERPA